MTHTQMSLSPTRWSLVLRRASPSVPLRLLALLPPLLFVAFPLPLVGRAATAQAAAVAGKKPVTIVFEAGGNPEELKCRQVAIEEFMKLNPDIKVEFRVLQGWTAERVVRFTTGAAPDVTMEWELEFPGFATKDAYLDLGQFIEKDVEFKQVLEKDMLVPLLQVFQWDGKQYALPEQTATVVLFYNKDHFQDAGLVEPPTAWDDPAWTWSAFLTTAQKLTKKKPDGSVSRYGYGDMWWTQLSMMVFGWSNGGEWFDRMINPTRSTMNNPAMVEAIQWYADLWNKHHVAPTWPERWNRDTAAAFADGDQSMGIGGHWFVPWFHSAKVNYDVAALPRGPKGKSGMSDLGTTGLAIYKTTKHPEAAWRLVKFLAGPEAQKIYARSGLFVPVVRSALPEFLAAEANTKRSGIFLTATSFAKPLPATPLWPQYVDKAFNPELHRVMMGEVLAAEAAARIDEITNKSIFGLR